VLLNTSPLLRVAGRLERREDVTHVRVSEIAPLDGAPDLPAGHDYH
jgi:hypothetical protein